MNAVDARPIDWKTLQQLAAEWGKTRVFPEQAAREYWARARLVRGSWNGGQNAWGPRR